MSRETLLDILRAGRQMERLVTRVERALADGDARARAAGVVIGPPRSERLPLRTE